jgi:hypothetical protein
MNILSLRLVSGVLLLLTLLPTQSVNDGGRPAEADGTLVVLVAWGDDDNTPASHVYIEAHAFVWKYHSERSFVLKGSTPGRYEASLPPGVYDVFVSDGGSEPRCRRMRIGEGLTETWTLKLKVDTVFTGEMKEPRAGKPANKAWGHV